MDPITHTILGATVAHVFVSKKLGRSALLFGAAGGALPDIDVFWGHLVSDPALPWEYHRHFTHALAFIPFGAALAVAPFLFFKRYREQLEWVYLAGLLGIFTHGLNDTLTSYGTYLYWPFSNDRIAWDVISIIDPVFTLPLIIGVLFALVLNRAWPTTLALSFATLYVVLGFVQNHRVLSVQQQLAVARGHVIEPGRSRAMPTMANIIVWRSLYESDGVLFADAVRAPLFGQPRVRAGTSIPRLTVDDLPSRTINADRVLQGFTKFSHFADDYTAIVSQNEWWIDVGDARYSLDTAGFTPLWGLRIYLEGAGRLDPVDWVNLAAETPRDRRDALSQLWSELVRPGPDFLPLDQVQP